MPLSGTDLVTSDPGAILLRLVNRAQSMAVGPSMAAAIRGAVLDLPFVANAEVSLADTAIDHGALDNWTHEYEIGSGADRLGRVRVGASDTAGFKPLEPMLRDACSLLGLSIAHRRAQMRFETQALAQSEQLEEGREELERHIAENARLAEVVRHSANPTYVMDLEFRLVWMNAAFLDTFGVLWTDAIGRRPSDVLYGDQGEPALVAEVRSALTATGHYGGEITNRDRLGQERVFALQLDRFRSVDGRHEGYVAIREDITERKRAERALAESEARFRDLTETASDWFWETDANHCFLSLSGAWPRPQGTDSDLVGTKRWDFAAGDTLSQHWRQHLDDLQNHRSFRDFRYILHRSGDALVHVSISGRPVFSTDGRFVGYRGTGRDITEEVTARETVDRLVRALDSIEDVVALFDADERLVFANRPYRALHPQFEGILVPGKRLGEILNDFALWGIIDNPEIEVPKRLRQFRNPSGPTDINRFGRWFRVKDQKLEDGGTLLIATDVTHSKDAELELRKAVDTAEEANAAKSGFLARMSHELRTPLNAILGLSETLMLMEDRLSPAKRREYLGDVMQAGRILLSHIDDILNFARLDADGFAVAPQPTDPRRSVAEVVRLMRAVARSRSVRLEAALARNLPNVLADPRSVRQILINLLSNAVKFSPKHGVVQLMVIQDGSRLRFSVSDHGIGIPADQIDRIFEPFHQVGNPSLAVPDSGTGLGLSIVKSLVDRNAGAVAVDSKPGRGTTISVWFPLTLDPAEQP